LLGNGSVRMLRRMNAHAAVERFLCDQCRMKESSRLVLARTSSESKYTRWAEQTVRAVRTGRFHFETETSLIVHRPYCDADA
jgi:hypothetical protein